MQHREMMDVCGTKTDAANEKPARRPLRVRTIEILWHCNERNEEAELLGLQSSVMEGITSVDHHPHEDRIVTTGGDGNIRLWELSTSALDAWLGNNVNDMLACCRHLCRMRTSWMPLTARWSPQGEMIASAHCDGKVCIWWRDPAGGSAAAAATMGEVGCGNVAGGNRGTHGPPDEGEGDVEEWKAYRHLTGHISDVYDLCFSADSHYLLSGAGDGSVVIHDLTGSTMPVLQLTDLHTKFCRGVAWDPWTRFLHTFGCGPSLLCFAHVPKNEHHRRRMHLAGQRKCQGDYIGESCALSYRRLSWSPDGLLLAVPYGKLNKSTSLQAPSTANLLASIEAKGKEEAAAARTTTDKGEKLASASSASTHLAVARPRNALDPVPITALDKGDEDLDDMVHCVYVYSRGAPEKVACRLGIRGFNEVRGVLWAPCFLEPAPSTGETSSTDGSSSVEFPRRMKKAPQKSRGASAEATAETGATGFSQPPRSDSPATITAAGDPSPAKSVGEAGGTDGPAPLSVTVEAVRRRGGAWGPSEYRMVLAVWTSDAVIVYTTDSSARHSDFTDLHMRSITDVTWSPNASHLYTASLDGYISVIAFGDSLAVTHRLPSFSSSPAVRSLCGLLKRIEEAGLTIEGGRSSGDSSIPNKGGASSAATTTTVAVVRKKKKLEKTAVTEIPAADASGTQNKDVDIQQLAALMADP